MQAFSSTLTRLALTALVGTAGCQSISDSVTSPSRWVAQSSGAFADSSQASADSSNAFSNSISGSSSPSDSSSEEARYQEDVRLAARTWGGSTASTDEFAREIGRVAERHGLTNWQADPATRPAVDTGLREAGLPDTEIQLRLAELFASPQASLLGAHPAP
jgi:hypothetical protein